MKQSWHDIQGCSFLRNHMDFQSEIYTDLAIYADITVLSLSLFS